MKNTVVTILSIVAFVGGFLALFLSGPVEKKTPVTNQAIQQTNIKQNLESKTDEQLAVTVTVTPVDISPVLPEWKFNIVMNNHEIELNQDLVKNTILVDNEGKEYKPLRWEGAEPDGHHREGVLIFKAITPNPKSIELKISGIKEVVRSFIWQLN
ncbi:MAG: hypothetical protein WC908_02630 [Candidatus Paceibacterota bacterium]